MKKTTFLSSIFIALAVIFYPSAEANGKANMLSQSMQVLGCTDSTALNYNPLATIDDGSCIGVVPPSSNVYVFTASGVNFSTDTLIVNVGDTIEFNLGTNHNAVEVSQSTWLANGATSNGGFNIGFGVVDTFVPLTAQTYYFVCQPHVNLGMKAVIIANAVVSQVSGCTDSLAINYNPLATIDDSSCVYCTYGCTDSLAINYDTLATCDDTSCVYPLVFDDLFFSEWSEGSSYNKYFEIFNPTTDTISLADYALARVNGNPTTIGTYEYWNNFDSGAVVLPLDVFIVAHTSADSLILAQADMLVSGTTALSNGDDGMALVYGVEPASPISPDGITYAIVDWIGDFNGDPGQGWSVSGIAAATRNHTIIRKCNVNSGDTSWTNSSANQWMVKPNDYWTNIGVHTYNTSVYDSTSFTICSGLSISVGVNTYDSTGVYIDVFAAANGCDSIVVTSLTVLPGAASIIVNDLTICDGDSIMVDSNYYFVSGTYVDTLLNSSGCDSIITTNLTVQTPTYLSYTICSGDSVSVGNSVYSLAGNYIDTLTSSIGCDSVVFTEVIVYSQFNSVYGGIENNTIGTGGMYTGNRSIILDCYMPSNLVSTLVYSADTNTVTFELRDDNGVLIDDTTHQLLPGGQRVALDFNLAVGSNYELGVNSTGVGLYRNNGGVNYPYALGAMASITGTTASSQNYYYFYYDIEIQQTNTPTIYTICDGDSINIVGSIYNTSGVYVDSLVSSLGCDSMVYSQLIVLPNINYINNQTICSGEVYTINGNIYDTSGVYIDTLTAANACDSIVTTNLVVLAVTGGMSTNNQTICYGDNITVGTNAYSSSGTYYDTLSTVNGCDSIVTTNLMVQTANYSSISVGIIDTTIAAGAYSNYNGYLLLDATVSTIIKSANVYALDTNNITFELRDDNGVVLDAITHTVYPGVQNLNFDFLLPVGVDYQLGISGGNSGLYRSNAGTGNVWGYPYVSGPVSITSSAAGGQYYYFYYDIEFMPYATYNKQTICEGDSVYVGNNIYNIPGVYTDSLLAANGCDSLVNTTVEFYQTPSLVIGTDPSPAEICLGDTILLEASHGFVSYAWTNGATTYITEDTPTEDTWYMVEVIDSNGCVQQEDIMVYVDSCVTAVDEITIINSVKVYPNPASDNVSINIAFEDKEEFLELQLINSLGQTLQTHTVFSQGEVNLDVSNLATGIYFINLANQEGKLIATEKLTKE